jgi:hypothetical protein
VGSIGGPVLAGIDSIEGLRAWRDFVVDLERQLECRGGCPIGSLGSQLAEVDPSSRSHVSASFVRWECALQGALRSMYERGALTPEADPEALSLALLAAVQGGLLLAQIHRSTRPLETALDNVLETAVGQYPVETIGPHRNAHHSRILDETRKFAQARLTRQAVFPGRGI